MSTAKANTASGRIEEAIGLQSRCSNQRGSGGMARASDTFVDVLEFWDKFVIPNPDSFEAS